MSVVFDFKSIKRKLERMEQKAEFEAKNPKIEPQTYYGWPYTGSNAVMPLDPPGPWEPPPGIA